MDTALCHVGDALITNLVEPLPWFDNVAVVLAVSFSGGGKRIKALKSRILVRIPFLHL